jgi:hypothetical protein
VKNTELIYTEGGVNWVDTENLKENPINKKVYSSESAEDSKVREIAISMKEESERGFDEDGNIIPPNIESIKIYKDGLISAGHTRYRASKRMGATRLKAEYTTDSYPNEQTPYTDLKNLTKSNIYRELVASVKLKNYQLKLEAFEKEFQRPMTTKEKDELLKSLKIARKTMKMLIEINDLQPALLKDIDKNATSIEYAYNVATGNDVKVTPKKLNGIDLFKLFTPEMKTRTMSYAITGLKQYRSMTVKTLDGDYSPIEDELGWEPSRFTGVVSDTFMWAMGRVLTEEGKEIVTASGKPMDPDVYLVNEDEKIEVKVTQFKGNGANTTWKGGKGIREGEYLLVAHDSDFDRLCIIFTTLNEDDWKKQGNVGTTLTLKKWWENHEPVGDYDFWKGEVYTASGLTCMTLESI